MERRTKLEGIFIPVITPFNKDESINFSAIKELAKFLAENGVTGIVDSAFSDCASLENITIPESIEYVGFSAFEDTPWLASQPDGIVFAGKVAIGFKGDIPSDFTLIIPNGTKAIGDGAFRFADWPEKIVLPNSLEKNR